MEGSGRTPWRRGKETEHTIHNRKRGPRLRFRFGVIVFIWVVVFASCFGLYMFACNLFGTDPDKESSADTTEATSDTTEPAPETTEPVTTEPEATETEPPATTAPAENVNPLPERDAKSADYFDDCIFVGDSITVGLSTYQFVPATRVYATIGLNITRVMTETVATEYGKIPILEGIEQAQPKYVYVMLGSNGIAWLSNETMLKQYHEFTSAVQEVSPDTEIVVMSIPPVTAGRENASESPIQNSDINTYNSELLKMANEYGYHYLDINTALKGNDGKLPEADASKDGMHFNKATYEVLVDYLLRHTPL